MAISSAELKRESPSMPRDARRGNPDLDAAFVQGMLEARLNLSIVSTLVDNGVPIDSLKQQIASRPNGIVFISWVPGLASLAVWQSRNRFLN